MDHPPPLHDILFLITRATASIGVETARAPAERVPRCHHGHVAANEPLQFCPLLPPPACRSHQRRVSRRHHGLVAGQYRLELARSPTTPGWVIGNIVTSV